MTNLGATTSATTSTTTSAAAGAAVYENIKPEDKSVHTLGGATVKSNPYSESKYAPYDIVPPDTSL